MIKKNIIANYIGQGWRTIMSLAFLPIYIKYLGIEAYGLLGIFALLQVGLTLLDVGMKPALSREMAKFTGGALDVQSIRDLLRTIEVISILLAFVAMLSIYSISGWLAVDWINRESLSADEVTGAIRLMGFVCVLRFVENIYISSILGLQKQTLQNVISSSISTIQAIGSVYVLIYISPTISVFFVWQLIVAVLSITVHKITLNRLFPIIERTPIFSYSALQRVWRFSGGVMIIMLLSAILTQTDKIILSRLLSLENFGYYSLASTVASVLYMLATPITQALYPRFSELVARNDYQTLAQLFHRGTQLVVILMGSAAVWLIFFSEQLISLWTGDPNLASHVAPIVTVLALGTLLNGLTWIPNQMQFAHGWTKLGIYENSIAVVLLIPLTLWVVPLYGAIGAAWVWTLLNAGYVMIGVQVMFSKILTTERSAWYWKDVTIPLLVTVLAGATIKILSPDHLNYTQATLLLVLGGGGVLISATLASSFGRAYVASIYNRR